MVDEEDSKSFGLITRVGSSPTTGTIIAPKCHASEHFLLRRSKDLNIFRKHWKNCICRRNLAGEIQMRVDIGCGADVTMPQPFLNFFQTHTIGVQQAGTAVPEIMKTYLFQLVLCQENLEMLGDEIGLNDFRMPLQILNRTIPFLEERNDTFLNVHGVSGIGGLPHLTTHHFQPFPDEVCKKDGSLVAAGICCFCRIYRVLSPP